MPAAVEELPSCGIMASANNLKFTEAATIHAAGLAVEQPTGPSQSPMSTLKMLIVSKVLMFFV
jgi:hypothetical protein